MVESSQLGQWRSLVATINLNQTNATYTLATATGDVVIDPRQCSWYVDVAAAAPLTSVSIVTNSTTVNTLLTVAEGVVANLVAQATLSPANVKPFILRSGKLLQYIIAGGVGGTGSQITVEIMYKPLGAGSGVLS
jgi:hypothetical protein